MERKKILLLWSAIEMMLAALLVVLFVKEAISVTTCILLICLLGIVSSAGLILFLRNK
ncbi:MAG: hypothetical protein IJ196_07050 [Prevotella sp.]|nr:hypothetical protein [Prevotella sp.]